MAVYFTSRCVNFIMVYSQEWTQLFSVEVLAFDQIASARWLSLVPQCFGFLKERLLKNMTTPHHSLAIR